MSTGKNQYSIFAVHMPGQEATCLCVTCCIARGEVNEQAEGGK